MKNKNTFAERLIAGLTSKGYVEDITDRSRYTAFTHTTEPARKVFVGKNGALRVGRTASDSISIGVPAGHSPQYKMVLAAGDKALEIARFAPRSESAICQAKSLDMV